MKCQCECGCENLRTVEDRGLQCRQCVLQGHPNSKHVCPRNAWPTGHPLPPEDPAKLQGPEVGEFMLYRPRTHVYMTKDGVREDVCETHEPRVVRVIRRSYVWSPGECRHNGGYRRYDWSVVEEGPDEYRSVVVDDADLEPLPLDQWSGKPKRVSVAYVIRP